MTIHTIEVRLCNFEALEADICLDRRWAIRHQVPQAVRNEAEIVLRPSHYVLQYRGPVPEGTDPAWTGDSKQWAFHLATKAMTILRLSFEAHLQSGNRPITRKTLTRRSWTSRMLMQPEVTLHTVALWVTSTAE